MPQIRVGIIGAGGRIAHARARHFAEEPDCKVVAFASRRVAKAKAMASRFGGEAFRNWQELIEDPAIDAVCVATPNAFHYEQAKGALEYNKHVLVEYPLCQTLEQADELKTIADQKSLILHHGLTVRGKPVFIAVSNALPQVGNLACARITYFGGASWHIKPKLVGNIFLAVHLHFIDLFRGWFGEVKSLFATRFEAVQGEDVMHSGTVLLEHERCPCALIEFGVGYLHKPVHTMHILGGEGLIEMADRIRLSRGGKTVELPASEDQSLKVDTHNFCAQIMQGSVALRSWADARRSMEVSVDCARAAESGQRITYP